MKKLNKKKVSRMLSVAVVAAAAIAALTVSVAAEGGLSDAPANVDNTSLNALITIAFWATRLIVAAAGGIPSVIKLVQGVSDENPRDRNGGILGLIATGVGVGATFAIEALF